MNDPAADTSLEARDGETVEKKEYVKPAICEGAQLPNAVAQGISTVGPN